MQKALFSCVEEKEEITKTVVCPDGDACEALGKIKRLSYVQFLLRLGLLSADRTEVRCFLPLFFKGRRGSVSVA